MANPYPPSIPVHDWRGVVVGDRNSGALTMPLALRHIEQNRQASPRGSTVALVAAGCLLATAIGWVALVHWLWPL